MKKLYSLILPVGLLLIIFGGVLFFLNFKSPTTLSAPTFWQVQSIDAMKYSRDTARENSNNPKFDMEIDAMMANIAATGATHVGIGTPYDKEFIPYLTRWVKSARKYGLKVWFRGNFSGWEGWFGYAKIDRQEHEKLFTSFISDNSFLFESGDIFTACPECENGGPGDPRMTGDAVGFRKFLEEETNLSAKLFRAKGLAVSANYNSMNADVAKLVMDKATTKALGGIVVIDHYVATPAELSAGIHEIAKSSGGKVILGEFGAPIPDLNGNLTEHEQAQWLDNAFKGLVINNDLVGVNYWVNKGGSTALWSESDNAREAVSVITDFYKPQIYSLSAHDQYGKPVQVKGIVSGKVYPSDKNGLLSVPYYKDGDITVVSQNDKTQVVKMSDPNQHYNLTFSLNYKGILSTLNTFFHP
ncbi:hypothetical protein BH09PAT1_BH09PAT1_6140 [soil metagenome]